MTHENSWFERGTLSPGLCDCQSETESSYTAEMSSTTDKKFEDCTITNRGLALLPLTHVGLCQGAIRHVSQTITIR